LRSFTQRVKAAALGFGHEQHEGGEQKAGTSANVKRSPPPVASTEISAHKIAQGEAHRNCQIEDSQHAAAPGLGKQVSDKSGRDCYEAGLPDADQRVPD